MIPLSFIGISFGMGLSFFLLYTRMKKWNTSKFRWIITGLFFIIGFIGLLIIEIEYENELAALFWGMIVPIIYNSVDRFFKLMSEKYQNRDFLLYLRNSDEIKEYPLDNPHVMPLDIIFSFGLLIIIFLTTLVPIMILK